MAARTLTSPKVTMKMDATIQNLMDDGTASVGVLNGNITDVLTTGADVDQANRGWQYRGKTLASGASITIDLFDITTLDIGAGAGLDAVGQSISPFEEIVAILIVNDNLSTVAGQLEVIPASSQGWTPIGSHTAATGGALRGQGALMKYQPAEAAFDVPGANSNSRITRTRGKIMHFCFRHFIGVRIVHL